MENASRDGNFVTTLLGVSSSDGITPLKLWVDPSTHRLLVDSASGSGTVTTVSVVSTNGFAGTVANATTTPAITLSTTITGILKGNGTAISAATPGTDYGTFSGPVSSTDKAIVRFNGTGGQTGQNSSVIVSDNGDVLVPSTATVGVQIYNTSDQVTNYERLALLWSTNLATIQTAKGGTGSDRSIQIMSSHGESLFIGSGGSSTGWFKWSGGTTGTVGIFGASFTAMGSTAVSGSNTAFSITPTYNQVSGSAANTDLLVNRTQTAVGSGAQLLIDAQIGGTSYFNLSNTGAVTLTNNGTAQANWGVTASGQFTVTGNSSATGLVHQVASGNTAGIRVGQTGVTNWNLSNVATTGSFTIGNSTVRQTIDINGATTFASGVRSSGSAAYFTITAPADTGITTTVESIGVNVVGATRTWVDGTVATQREYLFQAPTYNKTTTSATFTKAATLAVTGAPTAGSSVTITNPYAFWVQAGNTQLDGGLTTPQIVNPSNAITATSNAATIPITSRITTVTNNSAATLTLTFTTTGAVDGQLVMVRIYDASGVAQTLTLVNTENSTVTPPASTNGSTTLPLTLGLQFNASTTKWRVIASA